MSQIPFIFMALLAVLTVGTLSACQKQEAKLEEPDAPALHLPMTKVRVENLTEQLSLPGIVFALPDHSVKVSPGMAGKLVDVQVSPGDHVKKGQLIAELDKRQLTDAVNQAHAKVLLASANVQQATTNLLLAQNTEERNGKLVQQDVGAEKDLIAARSQVETARAQVVGAKAQVQDALAAEEAARAQLTYTHVKSPIDGLVAQRFLNISDSADTTTPIVQIVDLSRVVVEASLPTTQPAQIVRGQSAVITTQALPGRRIVGIVQSINPVTDNQGTTVGVRILCDNPGYLLKEGMPITASIVTFQHPHVMTVPVSALVSDPNEPDKKMVYIYKDKKVTRVPVKPGVQKDSRQEILSGLKAGQEIVASGAYGVPDGTEVEAQIGSLHADTKVTSKSD